jgi:hypothetical protein
MTLLLVFLLLQTSCACDVPMEPESPAADRFARGDRIEHRASAVPGAEGYLLDFSCAHASWDEPRALAEPRFTAAHDDAHPEMRWRMRAVDAHGVVLDEVIGSYAVQ